MPRPRLAPPPAPCTGRRWWPRRRPAAAAGRGGADPGWPARLPDLHLGHRRHPPGVMLPTAPCWRTGTGSPPWPSGCTSTAPSTCPSCRCRTATSTPSAASCCPRSASRWCIRAGPSGSRPFCRNFQPSIVTAVPRLFEVLRARMLAQLEKEAPFRQALFRRALALGLRRVDGPPLSLPERLLDTVLDRLVRDKVRARFGGPLQALGLGRGAAQPGPLRLLHRPRPAA